jgi:hypothetical protein
MPRIRSADNIKQESSMKRGSLFVWMSFVAVAFVLSGCSTCKQTGTISVHTLARSDAKGPWANSVIIVNGQGFAPNKRFSLSFRGLPSAAEQSTSWSARGLVGPVTDANGSFSFSVPVVSAASSISSYDHAIAALPPLDYYADPNGEVTVSVTESRGPWAEKEPVMHRFGRACTAQATIKTGDLIAASFNGVPAPADTAKAAAQ